MGKYKELTGKTRVGTFLKTVAPEVLELAANITGIDALEKVGDFIEGSDKLDEKIKAEALRLLELDIQDRDSARKMQIAALGQDDKFSKRFVYYMAAFWSVASVVFFYFAAFTEVKNERIVDTILGFVLGSIVATIINFFYGSSQGSKVKDDILSKIS